MASLRYHLITERVVTTQELFYTANDLKGFSAFARIDHDDLSSDVIDTLNEYSIKSSRLEGAAGIWLDADDKSKSRKICAIGIRSSRRVTMHGIALNINTDLNYFSYMNPCGFVDRGVTSMNKELGKELNFDEVADSLKKNIIKQFL